MTLDHFKCDESMCCNPEHVRPATLRNNILRSKTSPTAVNARKKKCPKCGGPYTLKPKGVGRYCRPCNLEYLVAYNAHRNKMN